MRIAVLGASFAGLTCAITLKERLGDRCEVVAISRSDDFVFMPSLIWVPFGLRSRADLTFKVRPVLESHKVQFVHDTAQRLDLENRQIILANGSLSYDYLVLATGPRLAFEEIPGLGPLSGYTESIFSIDHAERAYRAFENLVAHPGPVVVGAVQGASMFVAAYEFLFNIAHQLDQHGVGARAPLIYVSPEPHLGHLGIGGFGASSRVVEAFFAKRHIRAELNARVEKITPDTIHLADGRTIPFRMAMLAPALKGVDPVRSREDITDADGFVRAPRFYHTEEFPEVYACGTAISIPQPDFTPVPVGVPKMGFMAEEMARVVAHNVAAAILGEKPIALPPGAIAAKWILDAGNDGIFMLGDRVLEPRDRARLIPGPEAHWAKLAFEKYFLVSHSLGVV